MTRGDGPGSGQGRGSPEGRGVWGPAFAGGVWPACGSAPGAPPPPPPPTHCLTGTVPFISESVIDCGTVSVEAVPGAGACAAVCVGGGVAQSSAQPHFVAKVPTADGGARPLGRPPGAHCAGGSRSAVHDPPEAPLRSGLLGAALASDERVCGPARPPPTPPEECRGLPEAPLPKRPCPRAPRGPVSCPTPPKQSGGRRGRGH